MSLLKLILVSFLFGIAATVVMLGLAVLIGSKSVSIFLLPPVAILLFVFGFPPFANFNAAGAQAENLVILAGVILSIPFYALIGFLAISAFGFLKTRKG